MNLKKKLDSWLEHGLLQQEQMDKILLHEQGLKSQKNYVLYGILTIGVLTLVLGVISLVASNWENILWWQKLVGYVLVQSGLGFLYYRLSEKSKILGEISVVLFALFFFVGIGITSQVFHLDGTAWGGLSLWLVLSFSSVLSSQTRPLSYLWVSLFYITLMLFLDDKMKFLIEHYSIKEEAVFMGVAGIPYVVFSAFLLKPSLQWFSRYFKEVQVLLASAAFLLGTCFLGTYLWYEGGAASKLMLSIPLQVKAVHVIGFALVSTILFIKKDIFSKKQLSGVALYVFSTGLFVLPPMFIKVPESAVAAAVLYLFNLVTLAFVAVSYKRKALYDIITIVISIRIIAVFLEVFGSLFLTGIGLVAASLIIFMVAYVWHKYRNRLLGAMKNE